MRINHNIAALNTYRQLTVNTNQSGKALERLSSGLRINRAGDDAAGLAISEKMRGQIRGLNQASRNAQDGISLIQTAEGALQECHAILQRMRELAVQAANTTNADIDRSEIQNEINQLTSEINRIGNTTEFNTMKLLNGGSEGIIHNAAAGAATLTGGSDIVTQNAAVSGVVMGSDAAAAEVSAAVGGDEASASTSVGAAAASASVTVGADEASASATVDGNNVTFSGGENAAYNNLKINIATGAAEGEETAAFNTGTNTITITINDAATYNADDINALIAGIAGDAPENVSWEEITVSNEADDSSGANWATAVTDKQLAGGTAAQAAQATITFDGVPTEGATALIGDAVVGFWDSTSGFFADAEAAAAALGADHMIDINGLSDGADVQAAVVALNSQIADWNITAGEAGAVNIAAVETGEQVSQFAGVGSNAASSGQVSGAQLDVAITGSYAGYDIAFADGADSVAVDHEAKTITVTTTLASADNDSITALMEGSLGAGSVTFDYAGTFANLDSQSVALSADITEAVAATGALTFTDAPTEGSTFTIGDSTVIAVGENYAGQTAAQVVEAMELDVEAENVVLWDISGVEGADAAAASFAALSIDGITMEVNSADNTVVDLTAETAGFAGNSIGTAVGTDVTAGFNAVLQIGANSAQSFTIQIDDMRSQALGISGAAGTSPTEAGEAAFTAENYVTNGTSSTADEAALDVSTHEKASAALNIINDAINSVSAERSKLGAYQNRLEHTISNLGTSAENLQAAESRIRDVDMAQEMMEFTKNSILQQAATAMLAQANQAPQSVLQLLG